MPSLGWILRKRKNCYSTNTVSPECFKDEQKRKTDLVTSVMLSVLKGESTSKKKKNLGRGSCSKASKVFEFHYCKKIKEGRNRERGNFACKLYISYSRYE